MAKPIYIETQFLPSLKWFSVVYENELWIEANETYAKGSFRNRCHILGPNGEQRLSVPLIKGKTKQQIRDVKIAYDMPWQKGHWNSIKTAYGNSAYFEYYVDDIESAFLSKETFLLDYNTKMMNIIFEAIGMSNTVQFTSEYSKTLATETDFRNKITPKQIIPHIPNITYEQVFENKYGFVPNLSILDLLFCKGPESIEILRQTQIQTNTLTTD